MGKKERETGRVKTNGAQRDLGGGWEAGGAMRDREKERK